MKVDRTGTPLKLVPFLTAFLPFVVIYSGRQFYEDGLVAGLGVLLACAVSFSGVWYLSRLFVSRKK
jgi:hypothetical protein